MSIETVSDQGDYRSNSNPPEQLTTTSPTTEEFNDVYRRATGIVQNRTKESNSLPALELVNGDQSSNQSSQTLSPDMPPPGDHGHQALPTNRATSGQQVHPTDRSAEQPLSTERYISRMAPGAPPVREAQDPAIQRNIQNLNSESYLTRQRATNELLQTPLPQAYAAIRELATAANSLGSPELRSRARQVLDRLPEAVAVSGLYGMIDNPESTAQARQWANTALERRFQNSQSTEFRDGQDRIRRIQTTDINGDRQVLLDATYSASGDLSTVTARDTTFRRQADGSFIRLGGNEAYRNVQVTNRSQVNSSDPENNREGTLILQSGSETGRARTEWQPGGRTLIYDSNNNRTYDSVPPLDEEGGLIRDLESHSWRRR